MKIILITLLLAGCSGLPQENPISALFNECWFNEEGKTETPCISHKRIIPLVHHWVEATDSLDNYDITYYPHHTYTEVRKFCEEITGEKVNACVRWGNKKAAIWYVYGDVRAIKHEQNHIIYEATSWHQPKF